MAHLKIQYPGLASSLDYLRKQVFDSVPYCKKNIPDFDTPKQLYDYLKTKTTYKSDPHNTELFQTAQTLLSNNYWGEPGYGDCDCFSILCLASLISQGYYNIGIVLAGKNKYTPTHIYIYVDTDTGRKYLDLTNQKFDYQRPYPFTQEIPFKISKNQIDMFLQLADHPTKRRNRKKLDFLFMPSKGVKVREDQYDDLTLKDFSDHLLSEGYDLNQVSTLASKRTERKAERPRQIAKKQRQDTRTLTKTSKAERKTTTAQSKAEGRTARAEGKRMRGEAKLTKAELNPEEETPLTKILNKSGEIIGKVTQGGEVVPDDEETTDQDFDTTETDENEEELNDSGTINIFGLSIPKPVAYIGGALLLGYGLKKVLKVR